MAHSMQYNDDKKDYDRRSSIASSTSTASVASHASKASWVSTSDISIYQEDSGPNSRRGTPSGSRRASADSTASAAKQSQQRTSLYAAMRAYQNSPPVTIEHDRIISIELRRILPEEINHYSLHNAKSGMHLYKNGSLSSDVPPNAYGQQRSDLLPKSASLFMVDFTIRRSTGVLLTRSIRLSHCDYSSQNILVVLKASQLQLVTQQRVVLSDVIQLDSADFPYGLREPYASHANLSIKWDMTDPSQSMTKAYVVFFTHKWGASFDMTVKGRKSGSTRPTTVTLWTGQLKEKVIPETFEQLDQQGRERWLGPKKRIGNVEVYRDWLVTDITFGYDGTVKSAVLKRIRGPTTITLPSPPAPSTMTLRMAEEPKKSKSKSRFGF